MQLSSIFFFTHSTGIIKCISFRAVRLTLSKGQILDSSKLKELADNFIFDGNDRQCSNGYKTLWEKEKLFVTSNFSFSCSVSKRLVLQTRKNNGLFGKGLRLHYIALYNPTMKCRSKSHCLF